MKHMKGITPVVATILLLLIAIAMVGFASTFFFNIGQQAQQQGQQQLGNLQKTVSIVSLVPVVVSPPHAVVVQYQIGQVAVAASDLIKVYVVNPATGQIILDPNAVVSGSANTISVTAAITCGSVTGAQYQIAIRGPDGKAYATSGVNNCP